MSFSEDEDEDEDALAFLQEEDEDEDEPDSQVDAAYDGAAPWDHADDDQDDGQGGDQADGQDGQGGALADHVLFGSFEEVVERLGILQVPDVSFLTLKAALDTTFGHFNDFRVDRSTFETMVEKLGCECHVEPDETFVIQTPDGKLKGKAALQHGLHNFAQVIGVLHTSFMIHEDQRAANQEGLAFVDDEINVKLGELYVRHSVFTQRVMPDFDIMTPMTTSSQVFLNKAMKQYQTHAAFYKFIDGFGNGKKALQMHANTLFMIHYTTFQLSQMGYRVKNNLVYKQIVVPKRKPIATTTDEHGHDVYKCCHKNKLGKECGILRTNHRHPTKHLFKAKFEVSETETWDTHYWQPLDDDDFPGMESPTIANFVYRIATRNGKADDIIMANRKIANDVEHYLVKSCSPMVKFLEKGERTYACWNGILHSSKFYTYDNLPAHLENVCVDKFFEAWYFWEEDERAMRGKPCAELLPSDRFRAYKRPALFQFDGYVQNVYCTFCGNCEDRMDHSKCGHHASHRQSRSSGGGGGGGGSSAVPNGWAVLCTKCHSDPTQCLCAGGPHVYRLHALRYLEIPTIHWDQLIMTQIRGMKVRSPDGKWILLPRAQFMDTYRWATGLYFRPNFRIGPHAKMFEGEEAKKNKSVFADCWRVAFVVDGETNTGKSATMDMVKIYLPEFGNLSDSNQGKFMLEQCIERNKFKPILMGEMGPNTLGRTMFCALVDATTVIPVSRKGITDVNAVCDRGLTFLCNKFRLAGGDVEGSVQSRLAMLRYLVVVPSSKVDGMIFNRNENDPIPLCRKGNMCYEDISKHYGNSHFAEVCPMVFMENRAKFQEDANPLRKFLAEPYSDKLGPLVIDKDVYMKRKDLIDAFKEYCQLNGIARQPPWTDDHYDLRKAKIRKAHAGEICDDEGNAVMGQFVFGIAPRTDPKTIEILAEKQASPVGDGDGEDEDSGLTNMQLMDQVINSIDSVETALSILTDRSNVSRELTTAVRERLTMIQKHMDLIDDANEANDAIGGLDMDEDEDEDEDSL